MIRVIILFISLSIAYGQVSGRITSATTTEGLAGVNVMVKGTYYGSATDADGYYTISKINPGTYDIEASIIGYKVVLHTGINIEIGQTVVLDFTMEETVLTIGEEVVVMGKKPLFDVDETSSMTRVTSEDIANKVVSSVEDILAEQVGVTKQDNEIHIRGGRIDESLFVIDGLSIKDPLSGYSGNLFVNAEAIQDLEIVTGGYSAEYGQAMSGVVNITLKEGRDTFEGAFKYVSDNWGMADDVISHYNTDRIEFNLGGPDPFLELLPKKLGIDLPGKFSVFFNGYGKVYDGNLPVAGSLSPHRNWTPPPWMSEQSADNFLQSLSPRSNNDWHILYKVTWDISAKRKLSLSYDISLNINQGFFMPRAFSSTYFPYSYIEILDNYNTCLLYTSPSPRD